MIRAAVFVLLLPVLLCAGIFGRTVAHLMVRVADRIEPP
jgi:hypothetical protein